MIITTKVFFGRPQRVWKSEFPVGNSFLLRGTEKKTQTLNVVWEKEFPVGITFTLRGTEKKTQTPKWSGKNYK